jgi:8-oxo-dGTP pyrophosphatase MutT (NUDIX family)
MAEIDQAGAIAFTTRDGRPKILLVKARHAPQNWIFPKGHVELGESADVAALRELNEEAGVAARLLQPAGMLEFQSGEEAVRVHYFLARYFDAPRGGEERPFAELDLEDAAKALAHEDARQLLARVRPLVERAALECA